MDTDPLYKQVYRKILDEITAGKYANNQRLPTEREISGKYYVSRITAKKAMNMLAQENIIIRIKGRGSYVSPAVNQADGDSAEDVGRAIGIIFSDFSDEYGKDVFLAIEQAARERGILCVFYRSCGSQEAERKAALDMIDIGVCGIIIMPVHGAYYNAAVLKFALDGFPVVVIDRDLVGIPVNFVGTNNVDAARAAADYLLDAGHTRIAVFSPPAHKTSSLEARIKGVRQSFDAHGIPRDNITICTDICSTLPGCTTHQAFEIDLQKITDVLQSGPQTTAVLALEYQIAIIASHAAKTLGRCIPQDMVLVCFDSPQKRHRKDTYQFAHIHQDQDAIGKTAFEILAAQIDGRPPEMPSKVYVPFELRLGDSAPAQGLQH